MRHRQKSFSYHSILKKTKRIVRPPQAAIITFAAWLTRSALLHTEDQARSVVKQCTGGPASVSGPYLSGGPLRLAAGSTTMLPPLCNT